MNTFVKSVVNKKSKETTFTENGAITWKQTDSKVLDLFGVIGNSRKLNIETMFGAALAEDENLAVRVLMWARDIRGGAGERKTFRSLLGYLEKTNPALAGKIMFKIPLIGRWDDLFEYKEVINRRAAFEMIEDALYSGNALCAKWMPREKGTKSKLAAELRNYMGLTPKAYRKLLVENTKVVESQMCAKQWDQINFSHVPSLASARYQKAFGKKCGEHYLNYIRELQKPQEERAADVKINAGAVFPYDVVKSLQKGNAAVANAQFDALPDFVGDSRVLAVVDTSASMTWVEVAKGIQPYHIAMSLGLYCSSKTSSPFKDMVMHFSTESKIEILKGTLQQKLAQMQRMIVHGGTNIEAAFNEILNVAIKGNVKNEDMPTHLLILSDMQFDSCSVWNEKPIDMMKKKFKQYGYTVPTIVFWNLNARVADGSSPIKMNDKGVALVSGFSPAIMASVLGSNVDDYTPYNMMLKAIMNPRYDF